ncbi:atrial natriuretic peptide receptor 1-like [Paramacrobiotus metropolitanus]|uniref:atrial natriuretic peptide receptor 1-like n=1 Tax=Paramacrobiotus metropolitanus TaxID=2943436 RepID=UPI002445ABAA|nr:atrial natriuretic peptide receptor 1-like [Paramacrobiotus metropolitanus]
MRCHSGCWVSLCLLLHSWPVNGQDDGAAAVLEVRVVSAQIMDPSVSIGLVWVGAAMQLALQRANEKYAERGLRFVVRPVEAMYNQTCRTVGAAGIPFFTDYYYRHNLDQHTPDTCDIYFTNTCVDYFQLLCLSDEWNAFFFNSGIATQASLPPLPTDSHMLNLAGTEVGLARTLWGILNYWGWSHVAFFLDTRATTILYSSILSAAKALALQDGRANSNATIATYPFQANDNASVIEGLLRATENSRVFILCASGSAAYQIMDLASQLGMTNGEYVFFNVQSVQNDYYGKASLFNNPTPLMFNLTWNLIYLTVHESDGTDDERQLNGELRQLAYELYNTTYESGSQPLSNYATRMAYTSFELISRVFSDNMDKYRDMTSAQRAAFCDGHHLASLFYNRTVKLSLTEVQVDGNGLSTMDVDIWMFDSKTRNMSVFAVYRSVNGTFELKNTSVIDWPTGTPPLDVPLCGFSGLEGPCRNGVLAGSVLNVALPVAVGVAVVVLAASCGALFGVRKRARRNSRSRYWWLISEKELDGNLMSGAEVANPVSWRRRTVWLTALEVQGRANLPLLSQLVPDTTHANVNTLLGIVVLPHRAFLLSDYCKRGSLVTLLEVMKLDQDFQLAMARDLARGLSYLHGTIGRPHGCLSSDSCFIDDRFTLRIGQFGFTAIGHALLPVKDVDAIDCIKALSLPADIYAVGQILLLIIHQSASKIPSKLPAKAAGFETDEEDSESADYDIQRRLTLLANRCLHTNVALRPTAKQVLTAIGRLRVPGQKASSNIVDSIIRRFETYTLTLNEAVLIKTEELQTERKKCDDLLRELLPKSVVDQLRNRESMVAEYYSCVSVFFSDLDGFVAWVSRARPELVIETVTTMFSAFDGAIQEMDVHKVETVRDSYMVVGGIPNLGDNEHVREICRMAIKLMKVFESSGLSTNNTAISTEDNSAAVHTTHLLWEPVALRLRCGVHSGPCAAGVIGMRVPRYCLFGDTVNVAARMNSHGEGGRIHLSQASHDLLLSYDNDRRFLLQERGLLFVKGKGEMRTFWLLR